MARALIAMRRQPRRVAAIASVVLDVLALPLRPRRREGLDDVTYQYVVTFSSINPRAAFLPSEHNVFSPHPIRRRHRRVRH
jgi:hypothetical protein